MADNVNITQGSGTTVATDQVGSEHYQKVKLADGTADSSTMIASGSGLAAGALRVELPTDGTGVIANISSSIKVHILSTNGTMAVNVGKTDGTVTVRLDPGYEIGSIKGINSSVAVHVVGTAGTLAVKIDPASAGLARDDSAYVAGTSYGFPMMAVFDDTAPDSVDENDIGILRMTGNRLLMTNTAATASIFTVSGSTSGGTTSGVTLIAPSASYNFKIFAYSIQTTGIVSEAWRFTNGAGSETELWRPLVTAAASSSSPVGANLAVSPPGYIFATGVNTTLALKASSGSLVHYSVSYIKESA